MTSHVQRSKSRIASKQIAEAMAKYLRRLGMMKEVKLHI